MRMRQVIETIIDFESAVEELHELTSQELSKMLKDSENSTVKVETASGLIQVDMEKFASFLPLHLIAVLVATNGNCRLRYLLKGVRLLHSLCDIASRNNRLEQILLEEVRVSEQIIDFVFYMLIVLASYEKESRVESTLPLLHSALVSCSLHLLTGYISSQWQDLVHVLLVHPKVDVFMDVSFDAVRIDIRFFQIKILALNSEVVCNKSSLPAAERTVQSLCQHCEASLQLLHSLCQQKTFRERLLKNKELCRNGGIISLAHGILKFKIPSHFEECPSIVAAVCRLKSKILSILLQLCETESISYLDEVASSPKSMNVAKDFVSEILRILDAMFSKDPKKHCNEPGNKRPTGFVLLNSMRLADILSDDSNFRSFIVSNITPILADVLSQPHEDFISGWCSTNIHLAEEDASIEYDPFVAAGLALMPDSGNETNATCRLINNNMQPVSHAQQRTACLVKIIANLHCFVPNICEEQEKDQFVNKVLECLCTKSSTTVSNFSSDPKNKNPNRLYNNLGSLFDHAVSLVPSFLNEEDVQLLSVFSDKLRRGLISEKLRRGLMTPDVNQIESNKDSDDANTSPIPLAPNSSSSQLPAKDEIHSSKEASTLVTIAVNLAGLEQASNLNGELSRPSEHVEENVFDASLEKEKTEVASHDDKQSKKRKRNIMNEKQIKLIEGVLVNEPEMQRNSPMLQLWANKLSGHGSEITSSQLKNWLNNRKAKLARAARDARPSEGETTVQDKATSSTQFYDSPESAGDDHHGSGTVTKTCNLNTTKNELRGTDGSDLASQQNAKNTLSSPSARWKPGQSVAIVDEEGYTTGRGKIFQVEGEWQGINLEDKGMCVVDLTVLLVGGETAIPYPPLNYEGTITYNESEKMFGGMRVAWRARKINLLKH